ncbi:MAG TPA: XrtA system polysaccharide chain length determinant [Stellaceae bacterium]|jgi:polysaccharide chain length determinant protein (PEP-CTERM system associated)
MNSIIAQAMPTLQMVWRQKWYAIAAAWLVCSIGWIGVALIPTEYESSARIYLDADPLLTPLLRGLAADTEPTRHLDFLQRTLLSRPNLEQLVRLTDLDTGVTSPASRELLYKHLATAITITPITPNLMTISFHDKDPETAKNVVQALLTIFSEKTAGSSRSEMDSAQRFLDEEIASYRDQLHAKDQQRAELARRYPDIVSSVEPDSGNGGAAHSRLEEAKAAIVKVQNELADAVTVRDSLQKQISSVPPMLSVDRAPQVIVTGRANPDEQRLEQMRSNLDALRLKYTDQHPDVVAARQEIQEFEAEMKHSNLASTADGANKTQIPNNVYDQLKVKLVDAEDRVAAAKRQLSRAEAEANRIDKIAQSVPGVLLEVQDLDRDYGILKTNYEQLVVRRQATQIADAADTKTEKIQFRIIDPPQVPLVPAQPNRPVLVSVVLLAGLAAGVAAPIFMRQFDRSFATIGQLRDLGLPILGSVTRISLGTARRRSTMQLAGVCAGAVMLIAVYGVLLLLSLNLHPVDVS